MSKCVLMRSVSIVFQNQSGDRHINAKRRVHVGPDQVKNHARFLLNWPRLPLRTIGPWSNCSKRQSLGILITSAKYCSHARPSPAGGRRVGDEGDELAAVTLAITLTPILSPACGRGECEKCELVSARDQKGVASNGCVQRDTQQDQER